MKISDNARPWVVAAVLVPIAIALMAGIVYLMRPLAASVWTVPQQPQEHAATEQCGQLAKLYPPVAANSPIEALQLAHEAGPALSAAEAANRQAVQRAYTVDCTSPELANFGRAVPAPKASDFTVEYRTTECAAIEARASTASEPISIQESLDAQMDRTRFNQMQCTELLR